MDKPAQNIQDSFLNNARKEKGLVTIYLLSGVKLSGRIKSFDKYSLVLETNNQEQLIFKHAISTVVTIASHPAHGISHRESIRPGLHPHQWPWRAVAQHTDRLSRGDRTDDFARTVPRKSHSRRI